MKRAAVITPPEVIAVAVTASPALASSRRKGHSLKRALSANLSVSSTNKSNASPPQTPRDDATASPGAAAVASTEISPSSPAAAAADETPAATIPTRTASDPGPSPLPLSPPAVPLVSHGSSGSILKKADSEREMVFVPLAVAYLEQVKVELSVAKQASDIRYVMTVHHAKLHVKWRLARSFDEYRKFQQRLLKLLNHGHFCSAECPWMYTFLKSYFPKKHIFNFSSARVVDARKAALERFFATAQSFLLNRVNHGCGFMTAAFANELVDFIYGDMIKQYPLEQLTNVQTSVSGVVPGLLSRGRGRALTESVSVASSSDEELESFSIGGDALCQICDASLYGEAFAGKDRANSSLTGYSSSSLESLELDVIASSVAAAAAGVISVSPTSSSWSSTGSSSSSSYRRNTHYVTTLECGHQFHDECIVPKLNETLRCPTCGHLEVK